MRANPILKIFSLTALVVLVFSTAHADVYRCSSPSGVITLSNVKTGEKSCDKMILPPLEPRKKVYVPELPELDSSAKPKEKNANKTSYDMANAERKRIINEEIELKIDDRKNV